MKKLTSIFAVLLIAIALHAQTDTIVTPITLKSFDVTKTATSYDFKWVTVTEITNDHFTIERSFDGSNYKAIAAIKSQADANGNSTSELTYTYSIPIAQVLAGFGMIGISILLLFAGRLLSKKAFIVMTILTAIIFFTSCKKSNSDINGDRKVYFRLVQVDKDGHFSYSAVRAVN